MPTKDEIDDRLKQLAIAAQNHQPKTLGRQKAVTRLVMEIEKYKIINCPQNTKFSYAIYQEICAEAKQELMFRISREIHNYRPEKEVSQWVNFLIVKCFQETTPKVIGRKDLQTVYYGDMEPVFNQMEKQQVQHESCQVGADLIDMILEDPGNVFENEVSKKHPNVNFKVLLIKRVIEDASLQQISEELGVSVSTLSSFYHRDGS
ncbi:MAG: hypothetical protein EAZ10_19965 [Oscillatoriales cyanobacterium]|nr:MAG: hypothetical protein EAZ10_19965 [Oscillatoriales cyanobacterium]